MVPAEKVDKAVEAIAVEAIKAAGGVEMTGAGMVMSMVAKMRTILYAVVDRNRHDDAKTQQTLS